MKLTKKQINIIINNTPKEVKEKYIPMIENLGYYQKANANWSYQAGYIKHNDINILVVTVFGKIQ